MIVMIDLLIDHGLLKITILLFRLILIAAVQLDPLVKRRRDISYFLGFNIFITTSCANIFNGAGGVLEVDPSLSFGY